MLGKITFASASFLLLLGMAPGASAQQPAGQTAQHDAVADAARQAREQKKEHPQPKKIYTNDDLSSAPSREAPAASPEAPATSDSSATSGAPAGQNQAKAAASADKETPETKWRKRFTEQHAKIRQAEEQLDILQRELDKNQMQYYPDPQKALTEQHTRGDIQSRSAKIEAKKREIEQLKQQLSNMEDELRKSGGDPGWAR